MVSIVSSMLQDLRMKSFGVVLEEEVETRSTSIANSILES
jgi:hypothetical protein